MKSPVPLVLLHDSLGCVETWRDFPALLSERLGRRVIAYDRLGFGRSSARREEASFDFIQEEAEIHLPSLLKALSIETCVLFGHSVGGGMALTAAARKTLRCEAVISESAQAFVEERTLEGIRQAKDSFKEAGAFQKLIKYHGEKAAWVLRAWTDVWLSPDFRSWSLAEELPRIDCPVLAIHGEQDEFGSLRFPEMIVETTGGPAELEILNDRGHVPHREKREEVLSRVEAFLKRHS